MTQAGRVSGLHAIIVALLLGDFISGLSGLYRSAFSMYSGVESFSWCAGGCVQLFMLRMLSSSVSLGRLVSNVLESFNFLPCVNAEFVELPLQVVYYVRILNVLNVSARVVLTKSLLDAVWGIDEVDNERRVLSRCVAVQPG